MITISDNGAGISPQNLARVFDLFVQGDSSLDRSQGGLGIGLSVVRRLVEMHGGEVTAESEGLGKGSTFEIRLPLVEAPQATAPRAEVSRLTPQRVLVVDDNTDAADALAQLLRLQGHEVETVYTARDALLRAAVFAADVVLLDIGLPEMDGYELARRLREDPRSGTLVAVTGYGQPEDIRRAREAGFAAHLTKPVTLPDLERILEKVVAGEETLGR